MAGKIQDADVKSSSEVTAISRLINDTKIYVSANGINKQLSTAITDGDIGGGASGINYITNGRALSDTTGWATYADAAASRPVDGTGGSANVTLTRSTSSPLRGAADFLFTKDAVNRQGQGASYAFTIDAADQAKVLNISFDWAVGSGTFSGGSSSADSDLIVYVYDVTNAALIEPAPIKLDGAVIGTNYRYVSSFQTASNSTSYRLIVHCATTSAVAYTLQFDSFTVSPSVVTTGAYTSDAIEYTPTFTGFGTVSGVKVRSWRDGQYLFGEGSFATGTTTATQARISIGFAGVNGALVTSSSLNAGAEMIGSWTSTIANQRGVILGTPGLTYVQMGLETSASPGYSFMNGDAVTSSQSVSFNFKVPIAGWGTSQVLSSETDTRVVSAVYTGNPTGTPSTTPLIVNWPTVTKDSHGAYSAGSYTVPVSGDYDISAATRLTGTYSVNNLVGLSLYVNGSSTLTPGFLVMPAGASSAFPTISLKAYPLKSGDVVTIRVYSDGSALSYTNSPASHFFSIARVSGPSQIASSETIAAVYETAAGQSVANSTSTLIDFGTKVSDTHSAVTTGGSWKFTAPSSGIYAVDCMWEYAATTYAGTSSFTCTLFKNGSSVRLLGAHRTENGSSSSAPSGSGSTIISLVAGDFIDIRQFQDNGAAENMAANALSNHVSIYRISN